MLAWVTDAERLMPFRDVAMWFAGDPMRYRIVAYGLIFALAAVAIAGARSLRADRVLSRRPGAALFLGLGLLAIAGGRWPTFFSKDTLNEDEATLVAQALTALHFPAPWTGFDGTTTGPLDTYALDLAALAGMPLTYFTARIVALLCDFGAVAGMYAALSTLVSARVARLATIGPIAFFGLAQEEHYLHYSNETLSLCLISCGIACVAWIARSSRPTTAAFAAGVFVGAMPFAKAQSFPVGVAVGLLALGVAIVRGPSRAIGVRRAVLTLVGIFCVPTWLLAWAYAAGGIESFWYSYILNELAYKSVGERQPWSFLLATPEVAPYVDFGIGVAFVGAIVLFVRRARELTRIDYTYIASLIILAAAIDAVYEPHRGSLNYLQFAIVPVALAAGASLGVLFEAIGEGRIRFVAPAFVVGAIAFAPVASLVQPYAWLGSVGDLYYSSGDPLNGMLARYVHPGERMAVWGWRPQYNVAMQTLTGTRDSITQDQEWTDNNPYYAYYRHRYMLDIESIRPPVFLDAGQESFDWTNHVTGGHEDFPELRSFIATHYHQVATYKWFRIYVRDA
jgi:hypothetical protein